MNESGCILILETESVRVEVPTDTDEIYDFYCHLDEIYKRAKADKRAIKYQYKYKDGK